MPTRSKIFKFPDEIRAALDQRLRDNNFSNYVELSDWIGSIGYPIGKSQLQQYAVKNRAQILGARSIEGKASIPSAATLATQRIACLQIAIQMRPAKEALVFADELLDWAYR